MRMVLRRTFRFGSSLLQATATRSKIRDPQCFSTVAAPPLRQSSTLSTHVDNDDVIENVALSNEGKYLDVSFNDNTSYRFHTAWIKDSLPTAAGPETHRKDAQAVWALEKTKATAVTMKDSNSLELMFSRNGEASLPEEVNATWLRSYAPFVGKPLNAESPTSKMKPGTGSLFDKFTPLRKPWTTESLPEMPTYDAQRLLSDDIDYQIEFLENIVITGVALIENVGGPSSLSQPEVGYPLNDLVFNVVCRLNQHPVRSTNFGFVQKKANLGNQGKDYNASDPLSMHTDHSPYNGTPGFLQFMYQAQGSVTSKVCDGLALAQYVKEHHPEAYEILSTVEFTHSIRNCIYTKKGGAHNLSDQNAPAPFEFELVHNHPIIKVDEDGAVQQVIQSETKRGVCAFEFEKFDDVLEAYSLWTNLCEDPKFVKNFHWPEHTVLVTNNWRVLHGRASVPPEMERIMVFGYTQRNLVENRYRLLKMKQTARDSDVLDDQWILRSPNPILADMIV